MFFLPVPDFLEPEEVSAKAANRIDFKINGKTGSKVTLYAGEYVKFTIDCMWQNGQYIQTQGSNAYGDKINFKPSKELTLPVEETDATLLLLDL